jgi:hypothetical protein
VTIVLPIVTMVVATVVVTLTAMVVRTLVVVAVAIVSLRRGHGAADERERKSRSSQQTFHFDLPD